MASERLTQSYEYTVGYAEELWQSQYHDANEGVNVNHVTSVREAVSRAPVSS